MSTPSSERRTLTRKKAQGKIAGVCAGIADYFNMEVWLVRIITITMFVFSSSLIFILYIAAWFILDDEAPPAKPAAESAPKPNVKTKVWQAGDPPSKAFHDVTSQFSELERELQQMEHYVTSNAFKVDRELGRMAD